MTLPRIQLKSKRAEPFYARHPWVYAGAIAQVEGDPGDGAEVELVSAAGHFIARGIFNSRSKIRVRLYSWDRDRPIDPDLLRARLTRAVALRDQLGVRGPGRGCRLVFSEADGLSGCVVDEYAGWLAVQFTALGLAQRRDLIADLLAELIQPRGIYLRTERGVGRLEGLELQDGLLRGEEPPHDLTIEEAGVRFLVNLVEGQKTGFYHDQRDNRLAVRRLAAGRSVLDAFSYTGAFGLHCAHAGAASVECVDVSAPALTLARRNADLNGLTNVAFHQADVFRHLDHRVSEGRTYGLVILDPPKFARTRSAIPEALKGYRQLLKYACRLVDRDGFLVFCCCSGLISMDMLIELVAQTAASSKRDFQILERRGAAPDHPTSASCLETAYLKCLILRLE